MKKFALLMCLSVSRFLLDVFSDVFEFAIFTLYSDVYVCGETFNVGPLVFVIAQVALALFISFGSTVSNVVWNKSQYVVVRRSTS